MFKNAKVGDKVWSISRGWGVVIDIYNRSTYSIKVRFDKGGNFSYTCEGRYLEDDLNPALFWDEVRFVPPPKPAQQMTQAEYLSEPTCCPYCRSLNIDGSAVEINYNKAEQVIFCHDCAKSWTDVYQLAGYEEGSA